MIADILLVSIGFLGLFIASWIDLKIREVPDFISYSMIFSGFIIRLIHALVYSDWYYFVDGLVGFAIMFIFANMMYYGRQWGGGDSKLLMGLGILFATKPYFIQTKMIFLVYLLINILVIGALYGIIWSIVLALKHRHAFMKESRKLFSEKSIKRKLVMFTFFAVVVFSFFLATFSSKLRILLGFLTILVAVYPYFYVLIKAVENVCMYKEISVSKLTEGDWIVNKTLKKKYNISEIGIEKAQIELIKKSKLKSVTVKEGIPFVPCFFLGFIISIFLSNLFFLF
ncbi:MAG TPA: A24 family peptidase [Candidatus Nanoarchaeia archaeon]|nr:A24 family peptidase [Candidatus Nanoarchaeia archaeon]